jgi:hypothetical protein
MNSELDGLPMIPELTDDDFDVFKTAVHTLLVKTFIIRGIDKEEALYDFVIRNSAIFDAWFSCMDAQLVRDESLGVISFRGSGDTRIRLSREETCAILVFRLLYEEKRAELSLSAFPTITVFDFVQKYNAMTDDQIKKTRLTDILRRLQTLKLIELLSPEAADMEGLVVLYPSLAISVDRDSIDDILGSLTKRGEESAESAE